MEVIDASQTQAEVYVVLNFYYSYGILDRYLLEYFGQEGIAVLGKIPRTVTLSQAVAAGQSVAEFAPYSSAVPILEEMTEQILVLREES